MQSLSKRAVHTDVMQESNPQVINHIELAKQAGLVSHRAPTANIIGKSQQMALQTIFFQQSQWRSVGTPKLIAPAMNTNMYQNPNAPA